MDTDNSMVITTGNGGWGKVKESKGGEIVMEGDLTLGSEHTVQCTVDVL